MGFASGIVGFRAAVAALFLSSMAVWLLLIGHPFAYPLDDAYIHLSLARTLATAGVWGLDAADPAAASSSPLWTLLLAVSYRLVAWMPGDVFLVAPLLLAGAVGAALLILWDRLLVIARPQWRWAERGLALFALWLATPLTPLSLLGMEHGLHLLLATALLWRASRRLAAEPPSASGDFGELILLTALAVASRYESLFLVAPLGLYALLRRRWSAAFAFALGAMLPLAGFGLYWLSHGGWLLPNSLMLKASNPAAAGDVGHFAAGLLGNLRNNLALPSVLPTMTGLTLANVALLWRDLRARGAFWRPAPMMAVAALIATGLQYVFAGVGWLYRYEAWLVGLQALTVLLMARPAMRTAAQRGREWTVLLAAVAICVVAAPRSYRDMLHTFKAADDRRQEHLPPAKLIAAAYSGETVLVNDIGMMAYYSRARLLDLYGLGSNAPVALRRSPGGYDAATLANWATREGAKIGVLQFCWDEVNRRIPDGWRLVELWRVPRNVVFGDRDVGFFAFDAEAVAPLRRALRAFPPPPTVEVLHPSPEAFADYLRAARRGLSSPNGLCPRNP